MRRCKTLATAVAAMVLLGSSEWVQIPEAEVHDRGLDALHVGMSVTDAEAAPPLARTARPRAEISAVLLTDRLLFELRLRGVAETRQPPRW